MRKKLVIVIIMLVLITGGVQAADFREVNWGMSKEEVIQKEGKPIVTDGSVIVYKVSLFGSDFELVYQFHKNKLTTAIYSSIENYLSNYGQYISDYNSINNKLKQKYGVPEAEEKLYQNKAYKNTGDALNLQLGYLRMISTWETERTNISHLLMNSGDLGEYGELIIDHALFYKSVEYKYLVKQAEEKEIESNL